MAFAIMTFAGTEVFCVELTSSRSYLVFPASTPEEAQMIQDTVMQPAWDQEFAYYESKRVSQSKG